MSTKTFAQTLTSSSSSELHYQSKKSYVTDNAADINKLLLYMLYITSKTTAWTISFKQVTQDQSRNGTSACDPTGPVPDDGVGPVAAWNGRGLFPRRPKDL